MDRLNNSPISGKKVRVILLLIVLLFSLVKVSDRSAVQSAAEDRLFYLPLVNRNVEWVAWIGPDGGTVMDLAINPQNPKMIYAGTWGAGVFKSTDGGQVWQPASHGLGNLYINSLAVDPKSTNILYAGTYKGKLYKSVDAGVAWYLSSQGVQEEAIIYDIAIDPLNSQNIYIATRGLSNQGAPPWSGVVYKSDDAGNTWLPSLTDVGSASLQDWVYSLSIHPKAPTVIYAAAHEQGPYRSMDAGDTWEVVENGITDRAGRAIAVDPLSGIPAAVYFGAWHGGGVFKTTDGGETWSQISNGVYGNKVFSIAIDPIETSTLFLGTFTAGVLKTVDGGKSWFNSGLYNEEIFTLAVDPKDTQVVYSGTAGDGLYRSLASGEGWELSQKGLKGSPVTAFIFDGVNPQTYYASSLEIGVVTSADSGRTWLDYSTNLPNRAVYKLLKHPNNANILYALTSDSGLYLCEVEGSNCWIPVGEGLPYIGDVSSNDIVLEAAYPDMVTDSLEAGLMTTYVPLLTMTFAPADDAILYIGTYGAGVYKSIDGGLSWLPAGLPGEKVRTLVVDFVNPQYVYAATDGIGGLYISEDGGTNWIEAGLTDRVVNEIALLEKFTSTIYVGTDDGIYHRSGQEWVQSGLSGLDVQSIVAHPAVDDLFFAAAEDGGYLSRDGGEHWLSASPELEGIAVRSIAIDPNIPHTVFFITSTHGILRVRYPFIE